MDIQIDPARDRFLADHVVGDTTVLPTVMALDLLVRAASQGHPLAATVGIGDLEVGQPIVVNAAVVLRVTANELASSGRRVCEIRGTDTGDVHYRAVIETDAPRIHDPRIDPVWPRAVRPDLVYPPFFHGPTFQVVGGLGRVADGLVVSMAEDLPTLGWSSGDLQIRPRLLELFMQGCGLAAFAWSGRMMIPARIDRMTWHEPALRPFPGVHEEPAVAHISPRFGAGDGLRDSAVYDGCIVASNGEVLLTVAGYHAVDLGLPPDLELASALHARLDGDSDHDLSPAMSTTDVLPQPQGVRR